MSATPIDDSITGWTRHATLNSPRLYLAFELGWNQWKPGFATGLDATPRRKTIEARDPAALREMVAKAGRRFELPPSARSRFDAAALASTLLETTHP